MSDEVGMVLCRNGIRIGVPESQRRHSLAALATSRIEHAPHSHYDLQGLSIYTCRRTKLQLTRPTRSLPGCVAFSFRGTSSLAFPLLIIIRDFVLCYFILFIDRYGQDPHRSCSTGLVTSVSLAASPISG